MQSKILSSILLPILLTSSLLGRSICQSSIEELFPRVNSGTLSEILLEEAHTQAPDSLLNVLQTDEGLQESEVGSNLPFLTYIHMKALEACPGKIVADCGAGTGLFSAKLLAADASKVFSFELTKGGSMEIPKTIANYSKRLNKNFNGKLKVYQGDLAEQLQLLQETPVDVFCMFNLLHYLSPQKALEILHEAYKYASPGATLWGTVNGMGISNTPTGTSYKKAKAMQSAYPGYMMLDRLEPIEHVAADGTVTLGEKSLSDESYEVVASHPLGENAGIEPIYIWNGYYEASKEYTLANKNQLAPAYEIVKTFSDGSYQRRKKITKAFFFGDIDSIKRLLELAGWEVVEIGYMFLTPKATGILFNDEDLAPLASAIQEEGMPAHNISFKAIKKPAAQEEFLWLPKFLNDIIH